MLCHILHLFVRSGEDWLYIFDKIKKNKSYIYFLHCTIKDFIIMVFIVKFSSLSKH